MDGAEVLDTPVHILVLVEVVDLEAMDSQEILFQMLGQPKAEAEAEVPTLVNPVRRVYKAAKAAVAVATVDGVAALATGV
jgi:hypothetical protein